MGAYPEARLWKAVLMTFYEDVRRGLNIAQVKRIMATRHFETLCDLAGMQPCKARRKLLEMLP